MGSVFRKFRAISLDEYKTSTLVMFSIVMSFFSYILLQSPPSEEQNDNLNQTSATSTTTIIEEDPPHAPEILWYSYNIKKGMNLTTIFQKLNLPKSALYEIINLGKITKPLGNLRQNTAIEYALDKDGNLVQMDYTISPQKKLSVYLEDEKFQARIISTKLERRIHYTTAVIDANLSTAGKKAGLTRKMILAVADIFSWNINFQRDLRPGDSLTVIYEDFYAGDTKVREGSILAVRLYNKNKLHEAIRHTFADGHTQYFKPNGHSLRQAFIRRPLKYTRISSHFHASRKHPILGIVRKHPGVDYAAPLGTPIKAAGDGVVTYLGRKGGYGRTVMLRHGHLYTTLYAHLSKYASHLHKGKTVRKGDIIGYVGKSGLATGPHLHYEFWVKGNRVNPETVKLPLTEPLRGQEKKRFLASAKPLLNQLALYDKNNQANTGTA